jgi:hypothetical protein
VAGCFLHVSQRDTGIEGGGNEAVPERVGSDSLGDPGGTGYAADDPSGGVAVEPGAVAAEKNRTVGAFADREIDGAGGARCHRDENGLDAFAEHGDGAMPAFEAEVFDVSAECLGDPKS